MDANQFLAEFGHIANSQGGVARLRELVLRLAVQGRLSPQSNQDEPAANFLARTAHHMQNPVRRRSGKAGALVTGNFQELPYGWALTPLWKLANPQAGFAFKANQFNQSGIGLPIIRVRDVGASSPATYYAGEYRDEFLVQNGDWLIAMDGDFRVAKWEAGAALLNQRVTRLQFYSGEINYKYVCIALQFELRKLQGVKNYTTVDHLSGTQIAESKIALPPLEEQSRIVAKVGELMALCDQLEAHQQKRRTLQNHLRQATLQAVAASQSPHELKESWQRLQANFSQLFSAPVDVQLLRDTVIDLALRGKLLPALEYDNASENAISEAPILPKGWGWATLAELSEYITSGSRGWKRYIATTGDSFIRSQDIRHDKLQFENPAFVLLPEKTEGMRTLVQPGDLLLTITGGNVGKCAVVPKLKQDAYVSQHVALIRLRETSLAEFIHFWMINSFGGRQFLSQYIYGDKPGLNLKQVGSVIVPVPPISDCEKVLTSLKAYQKVCETLEQKLKSKHELATALATVSVSALTGIAIEQEEEPMKAPQTELLAPVRLGTPPDVKALAPLATILARHNGEMSAKDLWQRFGGEIDAFYAQLKTEVTHGWILEPKPAEMLEKLDS